MYSQLIRHNNTKRYKKSIRPAKPTDVTPHSLSRTQGCKRGFPVISRIKGKYYVWSKLSIYIGKKVLTPSSHSDKQSVVIVLTKILNTVRLTEVNLPCGVSLCVRQKSLRVPLFNDRPSHLVLRCPHVSNSRSL